MTSRKSADVGKVAKLMRNLDFCLMTTNSTEGMRSRPMSNNGEV